MITKAEVGIVGAGPAGARAAELLAGFGVDVVLFDPRAPWEKPCGGGLTASAFDAVPELRGVQPDAQDISTVRLETGGTLLTIPLERPIRVLSRTRLAVWQLARARAAGAHLESLNVRDIERVPGRGWRLDLGNNRSVHVARLVGADGAASRVRSVVAPGLQIELAPTRVAYPRGAGRTPTQIGLRFFPRVPGYVWDFPRRDHRSIGVGIAPNTWSRPRMDAELDRYWDALGRCECVQVMRAGAVIGTAARRLDWRYALVGQADYALLGDAAGFADPATGEGIQNALRSAEFLAEAFQHDGTFSSYSHIARSRLEREFDVARKVRGLLYTGSLASRLIGLAARHDFWYAVLATVVDGGNAHDPSLLRRLPLEWRRARRARSAVRASATAPPDRTPDTTTGCAASSAEDSGRCACGPPHDDSAADTFRDLVPAPWAAAGASGRTPGGNECTGDVQRMTPMTGTPTGGTHAGSG